MCGLVGIISLTSFGFDTNDITRFNQLLVCDSVRGPDSTGVFGVRKSGNVDYLKEKGNPFNLIESTEYEEFSDQMFKDYRIVVGHNRKATIGKVTDETAHPFQEGNIVLVHNGTLTNHKSLTDAEVEVDSHAITHAIVEKGYKDALKEIQGAFTLIWYDATDKCLRFVRNDKRPLTMVKTASRIYLSSEADLVKWILTRETWSNPKLEITTTKPGIVYKFDIEDQVGELEEEEVELYKEPVVVPNRSLVQVTGKVLHIDNAKKTLPTRQNPAAANSPYPGWDGYECSVGSSICVRTGELVLNETVNSGVQYHAILKGERLFPNQPPVYIFLTKAELDALQEGDEEYLWCNVHKLGTSEGEVIRIYCNKPDVYTPSYDFTGNEVFLEEWRLLRNTCCKKCGRITYWKDIQQTRFKFKSKYNHRIICKDCTK